MCQEFLRKHKIRKVVYSIHGDPDLREYGILKL
jgi:hypothetical protein